ncbi:MAG TPA: glycogen debranching enzyme, partial [Bacteroidota bacterium]|nr:glycogen debranching enzyme [Bacteroidota bacterium]
MPKRRKSDPAAALIDRLPGSSSPLGATVSHGGVNFCVYSKKAEAVELLLFDGAEDVGPSRTILLDPRRDKTGHYWHVFVPDIGPGQIYGYRVHGRYEPQQGMRFDAEKVLLDPYGKAVVVPAVYSRKLASQPGDNCAAAMRSVVTDPHAYDWEGDLHPRRPFVRTVIYEL